MKNVGVKGAWAYPGTAQIFRVPPIISGMGKATSFKFGWDIHSVHPNTSPLTFWTKVSVDVSRDCPNFLGYPLLSQEQVKLRTANFLCIFIASVGRKAH